MPTIGTTPAIAQGFADYMKLLAATLQELDNEQLARIVEVLLEAQRQGKKVLTMGNGGHGSTACAHHQRSGQAHDLQ